MTPFCDLINAVPPFPTAPAIAAWRSLSVVSTLNVLFGEGVSSFLGASSAVSLLVFSLLYTPCVAAIASVRRELGRKWALGVVVWQCAIAWIVAALIHLVFFLFGAV